MKKPWRGLSKVNPLHLGMLCIRITLPLDRLVRK